MFLVLASCAQNGETGPLRIVFVGEPGVIQDAGLRLSPAAQHVRSATSVGLVSLDQDGQILPGVAERWHVSQDGLFYTFKLRDASWSDGEPITADDVRSNFGSVVDQLKATSLGLDLAKLTEIRAMTGRVVELRLSSPMPEFLRLLAQAELGLTSNANSAGPMVASIDEESGLTQLSVLQPDELEAPDSSSGNRNSRPLVLQALESSEAISLFADGEIDLLLNGTLSDLPRVELGPLSRGAIQIDPAVGLFGLAFLNSNGVLSDPARREALSMAIDRNTLLEPFGLNGWQVTALIVPESLAVGSISQVSRWNDMSIDDRRAEALRRITAWENTEGIEALVRVRLPDGPGSDQLFSQLAQSWQVIGVESVRVGTDDAADLEMRDRVARYSSPRWFLNQFNCEITRGLCSQQADAIVRSSLDLQGPLTKAQALADAHAQLVSEEVFIPLGAPVRWSLVRGSVTGFETNPWAIHPLFPLSQVTN